MARSDAPRCLRLLSLVVLGSLAPSGAEADALRQFESVARDSPSDDGGDDTPAESGGSSGSSGSSGVERCVGEGCVDQLAPREFFGRMVLHTLAFPWLLPLHMADDPCLDGFAAHPHELGPGLALSTICAPEVAPAARTVLWELGVESGYLLQRVAPATASARVQLPLRLELDTRLSVLRDLAEQPAEHAWTLSSHVAYRFARSRRVDFRTGIGVRVFSFDVTSAGVDLLYGIDAYLGRIAIARIELHAGTLARSFAAEARATLGFMVGKVELYAGYDHTVIANQRSARLGGPIAGLRAWF